MPSTPHTRSQPRRHGTITDSDIGGFPVLQQCLISGLYSQLDYVADGAWYPYGAHSAAELAGRLSWLLARFAAFGTEEVCLACNSISATLHANERVIIPDGMKVRGIIEPAVEAIRRSGTCDPVGLIATRATIASDAYGMLFRRMVGNGELWQQPATELVDLVHAGTTSGAHLQDVFLSAVRRMLNAGVGSIIAGCTHFSLCRPALREALPRQVRLIDPSQEFFHEVIAAVSCPMTRLDQVNFHSTGNPAELQASICRHFGQKVRVQHLD